MNKINVTFLMSCVHIVTAVFVPPFLTTSYISIPPLTDNAYIYLNIKQPVDIEAAVSRDD